MLVNPCDPAVPATDPIDCTIVVVAFNSDRHIVPFLDSVGPAAGRLSWRVVVVDNSPVPTMAGLLAGRPGVTYVPTGANLGYSGGINIGRSRAAGSRSVLITNPDVRFEAGAIVALHRAVTEEGWGAAAPLLLDRDGTPSRSIRRDPTVLRQLGEAVFGDHVAGRPALLSEIVRDPAEYRHTHAVDWATGAVVMVSAACDAAVGPWDESFFLYSEEVDYAQRLRMAGFTFGFIPGAVAVHEGGGSGGPVRLMDLLIVNRLRHYRRGHGRVVSGLYALALLIHLGVRSARAAERGALWPLLRAALPGVLWGRFRHPAGKG